MSSRSLVVMARRPEAGHVKTRLIPALGPEGAARFHAASLADVLGQPVDGEVDRVLFAHPEPDDWMRERAADGWRLASQRGPALAERMIDAFERQFTRGCHAVVMRNSDSPDLPPQRIREAFERLESGACDAVFGPDQGGGYYLVGLTAMHPALFRDVTMGVGGMSEATREVAQRLGLRTEWLAMEADVDTPSDLQALARRLKVDAARAARCPETVKLMNAGGFAPSEPFVTD